MESHLELLCKECNPVKFGSIREGCIKTIDILECQISLSQCAPSDLRATCLKPFQEALESHQSKLVALALTGFHRLLRDNQFYSDNGKEDVEESKWLASQVLMALSSFPDHPEDVQIDVLKILMSLCCVPNVQLSGQLVVRVLDMACDGFRRGSQAMRSASQAAAVQAISTLVGYIATTSERSSKRIRDPAAVEGDETLSEASGSEALRREETEGEEEELEEVQSRFEAPAFDELVPIIYYVSEKLSQRKRETKKESPLPAIFLLECVNSMLERLYRVVGPSLESPTHARPSAVNEEGSRSYCSTMLVSALWQRLCPQLVDMLGAPENGKAARGQGRTQGQMGRGSGTSSSSQFFSSPEAKVIYSICCNLAVTMGAVGEMRPVIESLFHKMLLFPPPTSRVDALKAVAEVFANPQKLLQFAGPILLSDPRSSCQSDLGLLRLTMDSFMEVSNCKDSDLHLVLSECVFGLLSSLESLMDGSGLSLQHVAAVNEAFPFLQDVDYMGPVTYESQLPPESRAELADDDKTHSSMSEFGGGGGGVWSPSDADDEMTENEKDFEDSIHHCRSHDEDVALETVVGEMSETSGTCELEEQGIKDSESLSSGATEGPIDIGILDTEQQIFEEEEERLQRLSENLLANEPLEKEDHPMRKKSEEEVDARERANAAHFCSTLQALLPSLLAIRSTIEVDEAVLDFASKYCQGVFSATADASAPVIVNADGIYLSAYAALSFNLRLIKAGFYCQTQTLLPPLNKDQFASSVFGVGALVYLSYTWVGAVYDHVVRDSLLQRAGFQPDLSTNCALVNLLSDLDGLDGRNVLLSDHLRLEKSAFHEARSASKEAGLRLCRRILTCCWESSLASLSNTLRHLEPDGASAALLRLLLGENIRRDEARRSREILILCLNSLQAMTRLANCLGIQERCGMVFTLLSSACLPKEDQGSFSAAFPTSFLPKKPTTLHAAHVLSFHVMVTSGLELGPHAPDCWTHLFRCSLYLTELERKYFCRSDSSASTSSFPSSHSMSIPKPELRLPQSSDAFEADDFVLTIPTTCEASFSFDELMSECLKEASRAGFLSHGTSGDAICALSLLVDKLFDEAASQLNLPALADFLLALRRVSHWQLFARSATPGTPRRRLRFAAWRKTKQENKDLAGSSGLVEESLLLHRLAEVLLKVAKSGRPLVHVMKAWAVAGPHFLEAACHKDGVVSKKAICCIHDFVNVMLSGQSELPVFHFNEMLLKPFENLLRLELCDVDVQDQIMNSLCEFVEGSNAEIKSGWRPLFGALRCVKPFSVTSQTEISAAADSSLDAVGHLRAVRDVFEAFLATENLLVFANAALDCIVCLLRHVRGPVCDKLGSETVLGWDELVGCDLCLDALRFIHRCALVLASMHGMPACPVFHAAPRITKSTASHVVDWNVPGVDESYLWSLATNVNSFKYPKVDYSPLWPEVSEIDETSIQAMDDGTGLLQVWYSLLEGLAGAVLLCPKKHQSQALDTLFSLMKSLMNCPGPQFGLFCVNHFLLPLIQEWLRRPAGQASGRGPEDGPAFRQFVGLATDLVVDYLRQLGRQEDEAVRGACRLMLRQILHVLVECVSRSSEMVSRLGCACIRHISLACCDDLAPDLWLILVSAFHRASLVSLFPLYELMSLFCPDSPNFYGDLGQVKVAARRDSTARESDRLRYICHQVFQLEFQLIRPTTSVEPDSDAEDRSFVFLLFSNEEEEAEGEAEAQPRRVPFRSLVVGLLASQMLLQTLGQLLLRQSMRIVPSLANVLFQSGDESSRSSESVRGALGRMSHDHVSILLDSLRLTFEAALQFDRRPGLKFLVQKVGQTEKAANLYKLAGASWTLEMLTLFELALRDVQRGLTLENVKAILDLRSSSSAAESGPTDSREAEMNVKKLYETFAELSAEYAKVVSRHVERDSAADRFGDQPIFFITIPVDEFPSSLKTSLAEWSESLDEFNRQYLKSEPKSSKSSSDSDKNDGDGSGESPEKVTSAPLLPADEGPPETDSSPSQKPFSFSDLAHCLSSDRGDDEEDAPSESSGDSKEKDSGVVSNSGVEQCVYSIATEKDISELVQNYRRKKGCLSLPSNPQPGGATSKTNPFTPDEARPRVRPSDSVPPEVEQQQRESLMKDGEAHVKVWTEMVVSVFDLFSQLQDSELRTILPIIFPMLRSLTAHAHEACLRQALAELLNRVASIYGFNPEEPNQ